MAQAKRCEMPLCSGTELVRLEHESSWTLTKHYCPKCGRIYAIPTMAGKAAPLAPLATVGILAWSILSGDAEAAVEHAHDMIEHFL